MTSPDPNIPITLGALNRLIARLVTVPQTQNVWITAELSDVAVRGGHCYMELLEKDERGTQTAKARGVIWANNFGRLDARFFAATGQRFATGLKVMLRVSVTMHPVYGMSLVINDIDPDFTMGDLLRRRREIIERLTREGVIDMNRALTWGERIWRVAVISAPGAAGYGDFINQLYNNPSHLRFNTTLFEAVMQGERAPASIIAALDRIIDSGSEWDAVVIIRGGGATSDLQAFEDYELASAVAQFPIPVIIGIGHERDITVLDWVAKMRVKTPTAAAEWLITQGEQQLSQLQNTANTILRTVNDRLSGAREQLSYYTGLLPVAPVNALQRARHRMQSDLLTLRQISTKRLSPALERLNLYRQQIPTITAAAVSRQRQHLDAAEKLVAALSPRSVLARGYSITMSGGKTVRSVADITPGQTVTTHLADGAFTSTTN